MTKYIVNENIFSRQNIHFDLETIAQSITDKSEIFEVTNNIYIGALSLKRLIYIGTEIADYTLENLDPRPKSELKRHRECIDFCRKWLDDPNSVSNIGDLSINGSFNQYYFYMNNYPTFILKCIEGGDSRDIKMYFGNTIYGAIACINSQQRSRKKREYSVKKERERQGQFIIDFLKSDKSLFMV